MATSDNIYGNFYGKLGNLVSYKLKGRTVVRHIGKSTKAPSLAQLAIRQKMAIVIRFLRPALAFVNAGFEFEVTGTAKNPHNEAVSVNVKSALQGTYPHISLDYSKVLLSKGLLAPAILPAVSLTGTLLRFTWAVDADMDWGIKNDRTMLLVYCPDLHQTVYLLSGARRSAGQDEIELPLGYIGKQLHCYIAFKSSNGKRVSDSVWVGH